MSNLKSVSPSTKLADLRDNQAFPVVFYTKLGRNGLRSFRLTDQAGAPIDLTALVVKLVVKTSPDAVDDELDSNFPLTAAVTSPGNGEFNVDFALVNFLLPQSRVILTLFDTSGSNPVILAQSTTVIRKAGA